MISHRTVLNFCLPPFCLTKSENCKTPRTPSQIHLRSSFDGYEVQMPQRQLAGTKDDIFIVCVVKHCVSALRKSIEEADAVCLARNRMGFRRKGLNRSETEITSAASDAPCRISDKANPNNFDANTRQGIAPRSPILFPISVRFSSVLRSCPRCLGTTVKPG